MNINLSFNPNQAFSSKIQEFIKKPKIIRVNNFDEEPVKNFSNDFAEAVETGQPFIPIVIDSYGGYVYSLLAMIDIIKSSPVPVATIATGKAMSCGAVLLSAGTEGMRYATENSYIMIHEVSSAAFGKNEEIQSRAENTKKLNKQILEILSTNCGHKKDYFENIYRKEKQRADWYLDAKQAKKHNIINHIGYPNIEMEVSVKMKLKELTTD